MWGANPFPVTFTRTMIISIARHPLFRSPWVGMAWANIWILPFGFKYKSDISFSFFRSFFSFSDTHLFYLSSFFTITLVKQYNMQGSAAAAVRAFNRVAVRTYTSQAPKATVISANNETLQYLDRLKDSEIEFQSKGEYVSNDFWKTEPGKYRQKSMDVSFLYIAFHREKTHKLMLHSPITRLATRVNEGERLRCFLLIMYLSPYSHIPSFFPISIIILVTMYIFFLFLAKYMSFSSSCTITTRYCAIR